MKPQVSPAVVAKPATGSKNVTFNSVVGGIYAISARNGQSFAGATVLLGDTSSGDAEGAPVLIYIIRANATTVTVTPGNSWHQPVVVRVC